MNSFDLIGVLEHCSMTDGDCTNCVIKNIVECVGIKKKALHKIRDQQKIIEEQQKRIKELEDKAKRSITLEFNDEISEAMNDFFVYYAKKYNYPPYDKEGAE